MTKIPHARDIRQAIRAARTALRRARKGLNQVAGQQMAKGNYTAAEGLVSKGKEIQQFESEIERLAKRWQEICSQGDKGTKGPASPLWTFYQPILHALAKLGGAAARGDLEPEVERLMGPSLLPGDRVSMSRGRERWRIMIQRARKPLVGEGWIEPGTGLKWKITETGRQAAQRPAKDFPSRRD